MVRGFDIAYLKKITAWLLSVGFMLLCLLNSSCWAEVVVTPSKDSVNVVPAASFLRDASGVLTWEEVATPAWSGRFQSVKGDIANYGFTRAAVWMRVQVRSAEARPSTWLLVWKTTLIEELDVWVLHTNSVVVREMAGISQKASPGRCDSRYPCTRLMLGPLEEVTVFVRMRTQAPLDVPLWLYDPVAYAEQSTRWDLLNLFGFGSLAVLFVLALIFGLVTRIPGYLWYAASVIGDLTVCWISAGYWYWLQWPGRVFWSTQGLLLAMGTVTITLMLYSRAFFNLRRQLPRFDRFFLVLVAIGILLLPLSQIGPFQFWIQVLLLQLMVMGVISLGTAAFFVWRGDRTAMFYLISWIQFWVLWIVELLHYYDVLTLPFPPQWLSLIGLVVGYTCFFVSMADRVREMRMEGEKARLAARDRYFRGIEHITRDLHDGVGSMMANIGATAALRRIERSPEQWEHLLESIEQQASDASGEIRSLMNTLENREMYWADWLQELATFAQRTLSSYGLQLEWDRKGTMPATMPSLPGALSLMRAAKEAVSNAARHARAQNVRIYLDFSPDMLCVKIVDDGRGFGPEVRPGRGLGNMKRRIAELKGTMEIRQSAGTEVFFRVPLFGWDEVIQGAEGMTP